MPSAIRRHTEYGPQEKGRLRRLARREVPEVSTTAPPSQGGRKPFVVRVPAGIAGAHYERQKRAALLMTYLCAEDLGIEAPTVRLLLEVSPAQAGALVRQGTAENAHLRRVDTTAVGLAGDTVRVMVNRPPRDVARTAAHELRHIAQDEGPSLTHDTAERDAESYAEEAMHRLWPAVEEKL